MIMPQSAVMPRIATKPSGAWNMSSAATTPISPSGAVRNTMNIREKLCSCSIRIVRIVTSITGKTASERTVGLVAFLDGAADVDAIAGRQLRFDVLQHAAGSPASPTRPARRP